MYIGILKDYTLTYTRAGGQIPCPPATEHPTITWPWNATMLTPVEIHITYDRPIFAASVSFTVTGSPLTRAELLIPYEDGTKCLAMRNASSDAPFGGDIVLTAGRESAEFILRLTPALQQIALTRPAVAGYDRAEPVLFPIPDRVIYGEGRLPFSALSAAPSEDPDAAFADSYLADLTENRQYGAQPHGGLVSFIKDASLPADAYTLRVTTEKAEARASTRLGFLYAAERLMELTDENGAMVADIEDIPYKEMRGFHLGLPPREEIPLLKQIIRTILIPYHYNQLYIEFAGGMRFDSHPEISEGWERGNRLAEEGKMPAFPHGSMVAGGKLLEKEEVRDICDYAREFGFELIPEVQSFGHVQYITFVHPDIAEAADEEDTQKDTRLEDQPPAKIYPHTYCPQNPKSLAIIYDLIDEIVEVVRPQRFVHMGHDEIYEMGKCPRCKDIPHDVLYEQHVTALHDYLAKKGYRMMIWSDMLQPTERYLSYPARERLPKDIVMLDFIWYFHFDLDMEDHILPYGYPVMMGNLYSSHYPRYESRAAKENMIGGEVSTWCRFDEYNLAKKGKFFDLLYTGEILTNPAYDSRAREAYADVIIRRLPTLRDQIHGYAGQRPRTIAPLSITPACTSIPSAITNAATAAGLGTCTRLNTALTIPVARCAGALRFAHTTIYDEIRETWKPLTVIGEYEVRYADGTSAIIPVEYDGNIRCRYHRYGTPKGAQYYRHQGYVGTWFSDPVIQDTDEAGEPSVILRYEWENPTPEKEIAEIVCREYDTSAAGIVLCGVDIVDFH